MRRGQNLEFKELMDKIFRAKELAFATVVLGRYARRVLIRQIAGEEEDGCHV